MLKRITAIALALGITLTPSCATGWLYTHTTVPLAINFDSTPVQSGTSHGEVTNLSNSVIELEWGDNGIGHIAEQAGLSKVLYVDIELLSILYWSRTWVHVYGIKAES